MFAFSQQSSMKTFCFVSNSYSFLSSYKSSLSQLLLSTGDRVVWYVPYQELVKSSLSSTCPFPIKSSSNSRSGILSFIQLYFFFIIKLLSTPSSVYISHTVYPNIALMLAVLSVPFHRQSHHVFVSGFGPSRIRSSLRIRLLARLYLLLLRHASTHPKLYVYSLNHYDYNLIQDFKYSRKVDTVVEASVGENDLLPSLKSYNARLKRFRENPSSKIRIGFLGRFLLEKGLRDIYDASILIKKLCQDDFSISLCGTLDPFNSSSLSHADPLLNSLDIAVNSAQSYAEYFSSIDIFLFPSYREGQPYYILKAMAHGVVPIVYPTPGTTFHLINEFNGLVAGQCSSGSLVACLLKISENRNSLLSMSKNAREYALSYDEESVDQALASLLHRT